MDDCSDFLIPIDLQLNPLIDMKMFSPTFFGKLELAFNTEINPINFVGSVLNSAGANKFQRLHFYTAKPKISEIVYEKLAEAIERKVIENRPWCENLLPFIENPNHSEIVKSDSEMVFVVDRFPKGSSHYLCLPKKRIDTWWYLKVEDIPLLRKMLQEAVIFAKNVDSASQFKFGFHVIPSMKQLHLHIINKDFDAPNMTKVQWNAFNTDFLVSVPEVIAELETKGKIEMTQSRWDAYWSLLQAPLQCPICARSFRSISTLKIHYKKEYNTKKEYNDELINNKIKQ